MLTELLSSRDAGTAMRDYDHCLPSNDGPKSTSENCSSSGTDHAFGDPSLSVIIPNCNGRHHLEKCLPSIAAQTYNNLELVIVDNGSTDHSVEFTKTVFPDAKFVCNTRNLGFAAAVNQGVRSSSGEYVFILNNDTILEPDCIRVLVDTMHERKRQKENRVIGLAPKTLLLGLPIIDSIGNAINHDGSAFNVGIGQVDLGQFDEPMRVFGLCFAAAFIERSAFEHVGFLDESYFAYYEDVDWCYRANVLGHEFYSAPGALVQHRHSGSTRTLMTADRKYYLIHRNLLRTVFKNYFRGNLNQAFRRILIHCYEAFRSLRSIKLQKAGTHIKILAVTFLWLPILLAKNVMQNRRRLQTDHRIWEIPSERLVQVSCRTFDPVTYSPIVSFDVIEEILRHLAIKGGGKEIFEGYFNVHAVNNLIKQGFLRLSPRLAEALLNPSPSETGLRVKEVLGYRIGHMRLIMHKRQSYVVDEFLLGLLLIMKNRTLQETGAVLMEYALAQERKPDRPKSQDSATTLLQPVMVSLRWIVTYLAKLDLVETSGIDMLVS